ncbi:MAG: CsiV family protein [Cellvibrionaceae bacterium]
MLTHLLSPARRVSVKIRLVALSSIALCGLASAAQSSETEEPEADRWYQVEVILLAHKTSSDNEIWRNDIALAYPPNWTELKDPEALLIEAAACVPEAPETDGESIESGLADSSDKSELSPLSTADTEQPLSCPQAADLDREPYYLLPKELRALNEQAQELKWSRQHRVLFHQAWRQPIVDKTEATSIIINAGDAYGAHSELEGTLSISVSRYLHLKTNLWFSEFAHNYGQDKGLWPELPIRPSQQEYSLTQFEENIESPWDRVQPLNDEYDKILDRPFVPEQITLIKQKRRMRSKEVHYIDHPKVGIVILLEPYEIPELTPTESTAEDAGLESAEIEDQANDTTDSFSAEPQTSP